MIKENVLLIIEELREDTFKLENGMYVTCCDWNGEKWTRCYECDELGYPLDCSEEFEVRGRYIYDDEYEQAELYALEILY